MDHRIEGSSNIVAQCRDAAAQSPNPKLSKLYTHVKYTCMLTEYFLSTDWWEEVAGE